MNPVLAVPAWRVAIAQAPRWTDHYFSQARNAARDYPELQGAVAALAQDDPRLITELVASSNDASAFETHLAPLLERDPGLRTLAPPTLARVLQLWYERGDREALLAELEHRTEWQEAGWKIRAEAAAEAGQFQVAYEWANRYLPPIPSFSAEASRPIEDLRRAFYLNPTDVAAGLRLAQSELRHGLADDALATIEKLEQLEAAPDYLPRLRGAAFALQEDWEAAWTEVN